MRCEQLGLPLKSDGAKVDLLRWEDWRWCPPDLRRQLRQCSHALAGMRRKGIK
jgi:hypothetical protein